MKLAIVILNYNDGLLTFEYVKKLIDYKCLDLIIITDNGSTDDSVDILQKLVSDKVILLCTNNNIGYAKGNNFALKYISNNYKDISHVIISNPDIKVEEKTIISLINIFDKYENMFACTAEVYNNNGERIKNFIYKVPTTFSLFVESSPIIRTILRKIFGFSKRYNLNKIKANDELFYGDALPGCFFMANMSKFESLGFFCEKTFLYFEEDILFFKAKKNNYIVCVNKANTLIHAEGKSIKKNIKSWCKRDKIMTDSCLVYMKECLKVSNATILFYKLWNLIFRLERFIAYRVKSKN